MTPILVWRGAPVSMIKVSLLFIVFVPMDSQDQDVRLSMIGVLTDLA